MVLFIGFASLPYWFLSRTVRSSVALEHGRWLAGVDSSVLQVPRALYSVLGGPGWSGVYELPHVLLLIGFAPFLLVFGSRRAAWSALAELAVLFVLCDVVFVLFPAAPPWTVYGSGAMPISAGIARFACFPSFHVALGCVVARYGGEVGRWYGVVIALVVVLTGNHWVSDVLAGWFLEWLLVYCARRVARSRLRALRVPRRACRALLEVV
jgi:hypothetical protein